MVSTWVAMAFAGGLSAADAPEMCAGHVRRGCARGSSLWDFDETRRILLGNTMRSDFDIQRAFD